MTEAAVVAEQSAAIAHRMRLLLRELVGKAVDNMGADMFGAVIKPFLPMVLPLIDNMSDESALGILGFVEDRIAWVRRR